MWQLRVLDDAVRANPLEILASAGAGGADTFTLDGLVASVIAFLGAALTAKESTVVTASAVLGRSLRRSVLRLLSHLLEDANSGSSAAAIVAAALEKREAIATLVRAPHAAPVCR